MQGYDETSYGDGFADVYDDWYQGITDTGATVAALGALAQPGLPVLELGVGTGRLAVPLANTGREVHGLDASAAMLQQLAFNDPSGMVHAHLADMVDGMPDGPFGLVFVAYNTIFNLLSAERQQACFEAVACRLAPDAAFVVEAFVPSSTPPHGITGSDVSLRSLTVDRVVLSVSVTDTDAQTAQGQYIDITQAGGVRLRPWSIRYASPDELDAMAGRAGLQLTNRYESFDGAPYTTDSPRHVSVYRTFHTSVHPAAPFTQ